MAPVIGHAGNPGRRRRQIRPRKRNCCCQFTLSFPVFARYRVRGSLIQPPIPPSKPDHPREGFRACGRGQGALRSVRGCRPFCAENSPLGSFPGAPNPLHPFAQPLLLSAMPVYALREKDDGLCFVEGRGYLLFCRRARRMSRSASRWAAASRLSCACLPLHRPSCSFMRPSLR